MQQARQTFTIKNNYYRYKRNHQVCTQLDVNEEEKRSREENLIEHQPSWTPPFIIRRCLFEVWLFDKIGHKNRSQGTHLFWNLTDKLFHSNMRHSEHVHLLWAATQQRHLEEMSTLVRALPCGNKFRSHFRAHFTSTRSGFLSTSMMNSVSGFLVRFLLLFSLMPLWWDFDFLTENWKRVFEIGKVV